MDDAVGSLIENKGHPYTCNASSIQEAHLKKNSCGDAGASTAFHAEKDMMKHSEIELSEAGEQAEPSLSDLHTQEANVSKTRFQNTSASRKDFEDVFSTEKCESDMRAPELSTSKSGDRDESVAQKEVTEENMTIESLGQRRKRLFEKAEAAAAKGDTQKSIVSLLCCLSRGGYDDSPDKHLMEAETRL